MNLQITPELIDQTSDDDLAYLIFEQLWSRLPEDYEKMYSAVMTWTRPAQAFFITWMLDGEVNNGGFNQFFYNPAGVFADAAPEALLLIGAPRYADLMLRANQVYATASDEITGKQDGSLEGFSESYEDNPLTPLDDEFYALAALEHLHELQIAFIRKHREAFV